MKVLNFTVTTEFFNDLPDRNERDPNTSTTAVQTTSITIHFDRFLDPRTVIRQSVCLRSDLGPIEGAEDCAGGVLLTPTYDPVTRTATYYLADGELVSGNTYRFTLLRARDGVDFGIRAVDGAPLAEATFLDLEVENSPFGVPVEAPPTAAEAPTCDDVLAEFNLPCTGCHTREIGDSGEPGVGTMNLDLQSLQGISQAINRVARQTQVGGDADSPDTRPVRMGAAMPLIQPNSPGNSYLLYKALINHAPDEDTMAEGEIDRLRSAFVTGAPMPYNNSTEILDDDKLKLISQWIAAGAICE